MAYAHAGLGLAYTKRGDLHLAAAALGTAARLRPGDPRILGDWAATLVAQSRWSEAVAVLHRLEGLQRGSAEVARRLAAAYEALGDQSRADAYAARAIALAPREPRLRDLSP
jgi:Flp pilus assembly protein TadD